MNAVVGFIFWLVAARFFQANEVGLATSTVSAISLLALFSRVGLDMSLIRFLPNNKERGTHLINLCSTFSGILALVVSIVFIVGLGFWAPALVFLRDNYLYAAGFCVITMAFTLFTVMDGAFIGNRRAGFVLAKNSIYSSLRLALPFLLMGILGGSAILISWGTSVIVAFLASLLFFLPKVQPGYRPAINITKSEIEGMARFSSANYITQLALIAPGFLLPIMVINRLGAESAAYFYIAWSISALLVTISTATSTSLFAEGSYEQSKLGKNTKKTLKLTFLLLLPAAVIFFLLAENILHVFYGADYAQNGIGLIRVLIPTAIPLVFTNVLVSILRVEKKLTALVIVTLFLVVVSLGLAYYLLPIMGLVGGGLGWLAANCVVAVGAIIYLIRRNKSTKHKKPSHNN